MNADYLKALAYQVMIFRNALLENGADEKNGRHINYVVYR